MRFLSKQPYHDLRTVLYNKSRIDFEHACLDVLRVVHPGLQQVRESGELDRSGLDLIEYGPEARSIGLGIQCKGFETPDFRADKLRQCLTSIDSLRSSTLQIDDYVIALNRHVDRERDRDALNAALDSLVADGVCATATWMDPGAILRYTAERVQTGVDALIETANQSARDEHADRLGQGFYLSDVPFHSKDGASRDPGAFLERLVGAAQRARSDLAASKGIEPQSLAQKSVWAFVTGEFGFGKTSLLLGLPDRKVGYPLYLPIARFSETAFTNETSLTREIIGVIREHPYDHEQLHDRFVATNLRTTLKSRSDLVLLVDGLDEHPLMYDSRGMARVFSCFADFGATCVFSARAEFWRDRAGDLEAAIGSNPSRQTVIEMSEWGAEEILDYVRRYQSRTEAPGLLAFEAAIKAGRYEELYGDIPRRPLFLRMLAEDAERGEAATANLAELYERYLVRKFVRDREGSTQRAVVSRPLPDSFAGDRFAQTGKILRVLDRVAAGAIVAGPGWAPGAEPVAGVQMAPEMAESSVEAAVRAEGIPFRETLDVLQHSVLVPTGARTIDGITLRFAHRSFQEFFLARSILRGLSPEFYARQMGSGLSRFVSELRASNRDWQ